VLNWCALKGPKLNKTKCAPTLFFTLQPYDWFICIYLVSVQRKHSVCGVTIILGRKSGTYFGGGVEESRREHVYMMQTDHTSSLKLWIGKLEVWYSGNTLDLHSGRGVLCSNLGCDTDNFDWGILRHPWDPPSKCWESTRLGNDRRFLPNPLQFIVQQSSYQSKSKCWVINETPYMCHFLVFSPTTL
jgi:hypothetical protein